MTFHRHGRSLWLILLTALVNIGLAVPATRHGAAFILLWLLPGLAWAGLLAGRHRRPTAEEVAVGLGLGMGTVVLLTLLLHYIPGPLTLPTLLTAVNMLIFVLILAIPRPLDLGFGIWDLGFGLVSCVISVAAFFRLPHLSYSEFQGDEGIVMMRAASAILGDDAQLFYHQKGPAEVLLPMATWTLSGTINEWQARLPFAFAGLLGVVALYLLGRRWFNGRNGQIAALLLAINGYFVGFGRVVQYQSLVLAVTTLALLALWRWSEGEGRRWLIAGAALLSFGLLAHYDAGLALPTAAYIVGRRLWRARSEGHTLWVEVLSAGALALGIFALFYLPFICHPNFAKTLRYLSSARMGTKGPLYNNLLSSLPLATFYNSTYYLVGLASLLVVASFLPFRRLGLLIPTACYLLLILQSPISSLQSPTWVGPVLAGLLTAILLSRRSSAPSRAAWLWFGAPFLFYYFLVRDPRTHVLNVFPGACLLASLPLTRIWQHFHAPRFTPHVSRLTSHVSRFTFHALLLSSLAILVLLAYYPYLMFVQHDPEIKRTWPAHRPALYWRPDAELPHDGYFGFPYRAGWKVVGLLIEEGALSGVYASNEEQEVVGWYTRGAERTYCPDPEWYLIAQNVQDEVPINRDEIKAIYHLWGEIRVAGEPKLLIYHRGPAAAPPDIYHVEDYASRFDAGAMPESVIPPLPAGYTPAGYTLGDAVQLMGYRLDVADARPGGSIHLVLYWKALRPLETRYQVFNQLYDGAMWGQQDGTPGCALSPTVFWEPGQIVRDEYTIPIAPSTPPGDIPLLVGMYGLGTGERLPVCDPDGAPIGDTIPLAMVTVR
ncbi:MAG: glycosyltransferase family 39 protein [Chloroflexi bacterium]|nr:glycosyltransferase family 39 protein [Chloroflexota bacterium]